VNQTIKTMLVALALLGVACGGEEAEPAAVQTPAEEPEAAPQPEPNPEPEPAPVAVTEATLPVAEDFEAEMATTVTPENYRAELDAVIAELDAP
jgi:glucose/arabinose dehydrogenase